MRSRWSAGMALAIGVGEMFAMTGVVATAVAMAIVLEVEVEAEADFDIVVVDVPVVGTAVVSVFVAAVAGDKRKSAGGLLVGDGTRPAAGRAVWA